MPTPAASGTSGSPPPSARPVLVAGASGYVGGRLVPELLRLGVPVRCMSRSAASLAAAPWADRVEIVQADLLDAASLRGAFAGAGTLVYLVHSLGDEDFESVERRSAANACAAAAAAGIDHIVYLSGLGADDDELSPHLRSRHRVGQQLAAGGASVTELRAAVILGAGSASFEMLRSLVEVLPVMVAPRWVTTTEVQPIAIGDVLTYLLAAITTGAAGHHRVVQIGGPAAMTYRDLMDAYASAAGLPRRRIIPVPVVTPQLSSHWVNLVTPLPRQLARSLIDSLVNDVVVTDASADELVALDTLDADRAISLALSQVSGLDIPTRWSGVTTRQRSAQPQPWDPQWAGGTVLQDCQALTTDVPAAQVQRTVRGIGGRRGWYGFGALWALRGLADKVVGGAGLRRGRRHPDDIRVGEALDFWRVDAIEDDLFRLRAEMKMPGDAWLEWQTHIEDGRTVVVQRARFVPRGVTGRLYWWVLLPFHRAIFPAMLRRIVAVSAATSASAADPLADAAAGEDRPLAARV